MAFDIQAAKQAGYSDDEINAFLQAKPETKTIAPVAPGQEVDPGEPPPPPAADTYKQAGEGNFMPALGAAVTAVAPYVAGAAITGAGLYGVGKVGGFGRDMLNTAKEGLDAYKYGVNANTDMAQKAATQSAENLALQRERMLERMARSGDMAAKAELDALQQARTARVMPTGSAPGGSQAFQQMGQQLTQARAPMPTATAPMPTATAQPSMMQRGIDYANQMRQAAAQRVVPAMGQAGQMLGQAGQMAGRGLAAAAPAMRVGGMASNAMYSGDLNANEAAELERRRKMAPTITR
jgi:hypothetical protein